MATEDAQVEVERRLRDIGARLASLPGTNKDLLSLIEVTQFESVALASALLIITIVIHYFFLR
jgi:hypothetical protein